MIQLVDNIGENCGFGVDLVVKMHIERIKSKQGRKVYEQILLRESYREPGAPRSAVKKRTLLNLSSCSAKDVQAIELALK